MKNNLYFTSNLVRNLVTNNEDRVKIINTGVKVFAKSEGKGGDCTFRLAQEGAQMTVPFVNKRVLRVTKEDLELMLIKSDIEQPPAIHELNVETQEQLKDMPTGSVAFVYEDKKGC